MSYWDLSYKKKFLWNFIQVPLVIALIMWILFLDSLSLLLSVVFITVLVAITVSTLFYTYSKWKKEK